MNNATISLLVPAAQLDKVSRRLSRLAKKAGVAVEVVDGLTYHPVWERGSEEVKHEKGEHMVTRNCHRMAEGRVIECTRITIGEMPRLNGYTFMATVEHTEGGNLLHCAPAAHATDLPLHFRTGKPTCDHCNTARSRKETFIVRTPEGELIRVGRNCLADFLMCDPSRLVASSELSNYIEEVCEDREGGYGWGGAGSEITTARYLECAVAAVRILGFRKSDMDAPTKGSASFIAGPCPTGNGRGSEAARRDWRDWQPTEADKARAGEILAWITEMNTNLVVGSDYLHNCQVAARCPTINYRRTGILASLPSAYDRAMGKEAERKNQARAGHWGEVGKRQEVEATLFRIAYSENQWGMKTICTFKTDEGHTLTWFATGNAPTQGDSGRRFALKGTVKAHDEYKGFPQTVLSRVKWEMLPAVEAES